MLQALRSVQVTLRTESRRVEEETWAIRADIAYTPAFCKQADAFGAFFDSLTVRYLIVDVEVGSGFLNGDLGDNLELSLKGCFRLTSESSLAADLQRYC